MSRSERLLDLIQVLRQHRFAVCGTTLAQELGVSLRTVYRDIKALQNLGAPIDGEAGVGYELKPGFLLPPLMFTECEIEALLLGARWVTGRTDASLGEAARGAMAKIAAVLTTDLRRKLESSTLIIPPGDRSPQIDDLLPRLRQAVRCEKKITIGYRDKNSESTERVLWPFAIGFFDQALVFVAWCELRRDFRHFRADRVGSCKLHEENYPRPKHVLLAEWRQREGLPPTLLDL